MRVTNYSSVALCLLIAALGAIPGSAEAGDHVSAAKTSVVPKSVAPASVAVYQGLLRLTLLGEQVACDGPVLQTRLTYLAMPGICDDLGPHPCAGRLIAEIERCTLDGATLAAGSLAGGYSRSPVRFCFDPDALSPEDVVCSEHSRVGSGTWTGAGHADADAPVLAATAVLALQHVRTFRMDGRSRQLSRTPQIQHFNQERSVPGPLSCAVAQSGCGVIGVGVD